MATGDGRKPGVAAPGWSSRWNQNLRPIIRAAADIGIKHLTFYAFSTENWNRPEEEVSGLMSLLAEFLETELQELHKEGARLLHIGHLRFGSFVAEKVEDAIELTKNNNRIDVIFGVQLRRQRRNYHRGQKLIEAGTPTESIDVQIMSEAMFTAGTPTRISLSAPRARNAPATF